MGSQRSVEHGFSRRGALTRLGVGGLGAAFAARAGGALAQATPVAEAGTTHPIVGDWAVHDVEDTAAPHFRLVFAAAGLVIQIDPSAGEHVGVWRSTGGQTFELTVQQLINTGIAVIRGSGEVAADGRSFIVVYTIEAAFTDGTSSGQYGPGHIAGTQLMIGPMGTPVGPLSTLKAQIGAKPLPTPGS